MALDAHVPSDQPDLQTLLASPLELAHGPEWRKIGRAHV